MPSDRGAVSAVRFQSTSSPYSTEIADIIKTEPSQTTGTISRVIDQEPSNPKAASSISADINFVLLLKQTFDFEHTLIFNICELRDLKLSIFISRFAEATNVKMDRWDALKFTILLGDDRLNPVERVMKRDERRWQQMVEMIDDLWQYGQVNWDNDCKLKRRN